MFEDMSGTSRNYQSTQSNNLFAPSNVGPIPLIYSSNNNSNPNAQHPHPQSRNADRRASASNQINTPNSANGRKKSGRGGSRLPIRTPGECDPFEINIAPLNIFENHTC